MQTVLILRKKDEVQFISAILDKPIQTFVAIELSVEDWNATDASIETFRRTKVNFP